MDRPPHRDGQRPARSSAQGTGRGSGASGPADGRRPAAEAGGGDPKVFFRSAARPAGSDLFRNARRRGRSGPFRLPRRSRAFNWASLSLASPTSAGGGLIRGHAVQDVQRVVRLVPAHGGRPRSPRPSRRRWPTASAAAAVRPRCRLRTLASQSVVSHPSLRAQRRLRPQQSAVGERWSARPVPASTHLDTRCL